MFHLSINNDNIQQLDQTANRRHYDVPVAPSMYT